jgi:hypothetical protein
MPDTKLSNKEIRMKTRNMFFSAVQFIFLGLLLSSLSHLGGIVPSPAFAEDDLFERLQIMKPASETVEAPGFSLASVDGGMKSLDDYKGNLIFLNFWTTW